MEIIRLKGTAKRLYTLVGPLVMDADVLKQNNNYPFKTSEGHTWYVAIDEKKKVKGFMPFVVKGGKKVYIDNYFLQDDDTSTADALIDYITDDWFPEYTVTILAHKRHAELFRRNHFVTTKEWKNYETMEYEPSMEEGVQS